MQFNAVILAAGKTATGIPVPPEVVTALGAGRKPAVHVTVSGYHYRSTVSPWGEEFRIPLSAENRTAAGLTAGAEVVVELTLDTEPREAEVPADFAAALDAEPSVRAFFDGLSFSNQRSYLLWVEGTKNPETRARRVAQGVELLRGGQKHR
jgi:hypothetical protein